MSDRFDAVVVGAGAAGLLCAAMAGQRGLRVAVVDHAPRLAEKIRISGGGRCNFTNKAADRPDFYLGEQPGFAALALRAYPPHQFLSLLKRHQIGWHEKHRGQLFCDDSSESIIAMLKAECGRGHVRWWRPCTVQALERIGAASSEEAHRFVVRTDAGDLYARAVVVATGGLSIPKIGATDWGHRIARQFGLRVVEPRPALVPLTFDAAQWAPFAALAGVSCAVRMGLSAPEGRVPPSSPVFDEDVLLTHRGLSGPAVLQISSYWRPGQSLSIDLAPNVRLVETLQAQPDGGRQQLGTVLARFVPKRLAQAWLSAFEAQHGSGLAQKRVAELSRRTAHALGEGFHGWSIKPVGTEGWRKAEVTAGGVATDELDPRTLQAHRVPGLYFIGEVVDITGWLGGFNFQWAWASAWSAACALAVA